MPHPLSVEIDAGAAFPGWRNPVLCKLLFTSAAAGATVTVLSSSAPGMSVGPFATNSFPVTFPKCKNARVERCNVSPATPGTVANHRQCPTDLPNAANGTVNAYMVAANGGAFSAPENGSTVELLIWLDLG
jgi:hypothetical protein